MTAAPPAKIGEHTDAVLAELAPLTSSGIAVGDHVGGGTGAECVLRLIPGGGTDGSLCDPQSDVTFVWQVTSIGRLASEARWVADKVRTQLQGVTIAVAGRAVRPLRLVSSSPGAERDDDLPGDDPRFYCWDRFSAFSEPSDTGS